MKDSKMIKNSEKRKKKRKLAKTSEETSEPQKKPKLSTIAASVSWDLKSILADPEAALEPLKTFLALPNASTDAASTDEAEEDGGNASPTPIGIFEETCDRFIDESPEFVQLFTLLEKWSKKNSELKVALELMDALLLRLLTRRQRKDEAKNEVGEEEEEEVVDEDDGGGNERTVKFALQLAAVSKRLLQDQTQVFYKLMDNRNNAAQIKAALKTLTTVTAGGPSGVRLILDHLDLTHPNFPALLDRRDKRDEKDVR